MTTATMERENVIDLSKELGINIDLSDCPEFAMTPAMGILDPNEGPVEVPGRYYTMVETKDGWKFVKEVSKNYKMIQHWEVLGSFLQNVQPFIDLLGKPVVKPTFQNDGCRMFTQFRFNDVEKQVNGDKIVPIVQLENSADLTRQLGSAFRAERLACTNGMMLPDSRFSSGKANTRHYGAEDTVLLDSFVQESLGAVDEFIAGIEQWDRWNKKSISVGEFIDLANHVGFSEPQTEEIIHEPLRGFKMYGSSAPTLEQEFVGGGDANLWRAYNAVTQFITDNTENLTSEGNRSKKAANLFEIVATEQKAK